MNDDASSSAWWKALIDDYVHAMLAPRDFAGAPSTHQIAVEGRARLATIDAGGSLSSL